jgi:hypothetical protein
LHLLLKLALTTRLPHNMLTSHLGVPQEAILTDLHPLLHESRIELAPSIDLPRRAIPQFGKEGLEQWRNLFLLLLLLDLTLRFLPFLYWRTPRPPGDPVERQFFLV